MEQRGDPHRALENHPVLAPARTAVEHGPLVTPGGLAIASSRPKIHTANSELAARGRSGSAWALSSSSAAGA